LLKFALELQNTPINDLDLSENLLGKQSVKELITFVSAIPTSVISINFIKNGLFL